MGGGVLIDTKRSRVNFGRLYYIDWRQSTHSRTQEEAGAGSTWDCRCSASEFKNIPLPPGEVAVLLRWRRSYGCASTARYASPILFFCSPLSGWHKGIGIYPFILGFATTCRDGLRPVHYCRVARPSLLLIAQPCHIRH